MCTKISFLKSSVVCCTLLLSASTLASNPFQRPEIKVVEQPVYEDVPANFDNPYDDDLSLEEPVNEVKPKGNPLLAKESVVYKGSINGVDVYYDKATGLYIHDKNELETVEVLTSNLPDLEKVNY